MDILIKSVSEFAQTSPDAIAVKCGSHDLSYRQLINRSNAVAHSLIEANLEPGDQVGICMSRSVDLVPSILAIISLGAAFVPLDPQFPIARLESILANTDIKYLLADKSAPDLNCSKLYIEQIPHNAETPFKTDMRDDALAYIMHTSGSTGKPKGVKVSRRNLENLLIAMHDQFDLNCNDKLLAVTTIAFDISILELLLPLLSGSTVVIANETETRDGHLLAGLIRHQGITIMQATPATWQMLLVADWQGAKALTALCGGEALSPGLAKELVHRVGALWNMYGPTETTIWSTCVLVDGTEDCITVGHPILNTDCLIVDSELKPVPDGGTGELIIGGDGVCLGYTDPALDTDRFVTIGQSDVKTHRYYRTGDLAHLTPEGKIVLKGRIDDQIKLRGYRIELDDVSNGLSQVSGIAGAKAICINDAESNPTLVAFCTTSSDIKEASIRKEVSNILPAYMVPDQIILLEEMPLGPNGKIDKSELRKIANQNTKSSASGKSHGSLEEKVFKIVCELTGKPEISADTNLFDEGLTSLKVNILAARLSALMGFRVAVAQLFNSPNVKSILEILKGESPAQASKKRDKTGSNAPKREPIAIIGMAVRVPGADTPDEFWDIIENGRDTVTRFEANQDDDLVPQDIRDDPHYVRARGILPNPDQFDAHFFDISPNDARVMDPQQRIFLELAWHALEDAGYTGNSAMDKAAVYAGMGNNFYYHYHVASNPDFIRMVGEVQTEIGREKDHIATLVSHKLDLMGPSISVHTACSTGLVAIDQACHSLLSGQSEMAMAGAIEVCTPQMSGQIGEPDGIFTEDGFCRPFSSDATGTMFSDGAGIVVLKRLSDARRDGDRILATILGTAVNHDGLQKKSYLAPNTLAQTEVIKLAQNRAGIAPDTIGYMEAHGTATPVGDPIEFSALCDAFDQDDIGRGICALGSVKANLGHPTTAAGVVGVIKALLCLAHKVRPPLANFTGQVNPQIDIDNSPFYIPATSEFWPSANHPRRAAVSSFGFCGTNAHAILEEAPDTEELSYPRRKAEIFIASAKTKTALSNITNAYSKAIDDDNAQEASFTLATGRMHHPWRSFATDPLDFAPPIQSKVEAPKLAFVFPGQGVQFTGMGLDLAAQETDFAESLADISKELKHHLDCDIRDVIASGHELAQTYYTQPAIFAVELAMASRMQFLGLTPDYLIGHSVGEFTAAVVSGVMSLPDAARMVCLRARLMNEQPAGSMIATRLSEAELRPFLTNDLECAVINSKNAVVAGGPVSGIARLHERLESEGHKSLILKTSHAFHTSSMEVAAAEFQKAMAKIDLQPPEVPIISTMTGKIMTASQARDPGYWGNQIRRPVLYAGAVDTLWLEPNITLVEAGPGQGLSRLAAASRTDRATQNTLPTMTAPAEGLPTECRSMAAAVGKLWAIGHDINWSNYFEGRTQRRIALPGYVFDHSSYWLEPGKTVIEQSSQNLSDTNDDTLEEEDFDKDTIVNELRIIFGSACGRDFSDVPEDASFFDEGLDSLLLNQIIFMVKDCYGVKVTFRELSRNLASLSALAEFILNAYADEENLDEAAAAVDLTAVSLSAKQKAILEKPELEFEQAGATISLNGKIDRARLHEALDQLARLHPALRASLNEKGSELEISDAPLAPIESNKIDPRRGGALWHSSLSETGQGLDLTITLHGMICDGWALDVLIEDLATLYSGNSPQPVQGFNRTDVAMLDPAGAILPAGQTDRAVHRRAEIDHLSLKALKSLASENNCTVFVGWLTQIFLEMWSHSPNRQVGILVASAAQPKLNMPRLVTNCMDYLPLIQHPLAEPEFSHVSQSLQDALADASEHKSSREKPDSVHFELGGQAFVGEFIHIKRLTDRQLQFGDLEASYSLEPPKVLCADFRITLIEGEERAELVLSRKENLDSFSPLDQFLEGLIARLKTPKIKGSASYSIAS